MFLRNFLLSIVLLFIFILSFFSCAQVGSPAGGAKDTIPPILLTENPPNFTVERDVKGMKAKISFNEYVRLSDLQKNLYISPLTEKEPEVKLNGKKIIIKVDDSLRKNITYTVSLGTAIVDNNENNPFGVYKYVFSTGDVCDSLSVRGQVLNAENLEKIENIWVMLYENYNDSTPILKRPSYIAKTDTAGRYSIEYIHPGEYRIFALKDGNRNYLFDMPTEMIAYSDAVLLPKASHKEVIDTLRKPLGDSLFVDSIYTRHFVDFTPKDVDLRMFTEDRRKQFIVSNKRDDKRQINIAFNRPLWNDTVAIKAIGFDKYEDVFFNEISTNYDSLTVWTADTLTANLDSLQFEVSFQIKDSLEQLVFKKDTLLMKLPKKKELPKEDDKEKPKRKDKDKEKKEAVVLLERSADSSVVLDLEIKDNIGGLHGLEKDLLLFSHTPLKTIDIGKITLSIKKDTLYKPVKFEFVSDTSWNRAYRIKAKWEENASYKLFVDTMAFVNFYQQGNDTIKKIFNTRSKDFYSTITLALTYTNTNANGILQLWNKKSVIKEVVVKGMAEPQTIVFDFLPADTYQFKIITDDNDNKKWDTGNYLKNVQPEKVFVFDKKIPLKANWEDNQEWIVK